MQATSPTPGLYNCTTFALRSKLHRCAADFVEQILNDEAEALIYGKFFQDALAPQGVTHECRGDKIGKHCRVAQIGEVPVHFRRKLSWPICFYVRIKLQDLGGERVGFYRGVGVGFKSLNCRDRKRCLLFEIGEADALQSLQNQI